MKRRPPSIQCEGLDPAVAAGWCSALATSRGVPMKSLLLAAHCVTLQRLSGEPDVTTGLVTHGRPGMAGAEWPPGCFSTRFPIRLDKKPVTCVDAVEHIARLERTSHRYRRYPLQAMQSDAGRPLFNTAFNFVNYHLFAELGRATGSNCSTSRYPSGRTSCCSRPRASIRALDGCSYASTAIRRRHGDPSTRIRECVHACAGGSRTPTRAAVVVDGCAG